MSPPLLKNFPLERADLSLGWELSSFAPEHCRQRIALLIAFYRFARAHGSSCLPLSPPVLAEVYAHLPEALEEEDGIRVSLEELHRAAAELPKISSLTGLGQPFVLRAEGMLSLRDDLAEASLAESVRRLRRQPSPDPRAVEEAARFVLERPAVVNDVEIRLSRSQEQALRFALSSPMTLLSGEPGTGKTTIAVSLLRAFLSLGYRPEEMVLCAPTGRAADRLGRSIARSLEGLPSPMPEERALLSVRAQTVHRLLGYSPRRRGFRYGASRPVQARVVLVDESSMLDLELAKALFDAIHSGGDRATRVILLGDAQQLPAVGVGAVYRQLMEGMPDCAVRLTESHRMRADDPEGSAVLHAARRTREGGTSFVRYEPIRSLRQLRFSGFERASFLSVDGSLDSLAIDYFLREWLSRFGPAGTARGTGQILTLTRGRGLGALGIGERATAIRGGRGGEWLAGDPVLITRNDYERGLFNGDLGRVVEGPSGQDAQFGEARFALAALRNNAELAYGITVHKAQGSEWDHVALVVPESSSSLATRELIYTGITRAKRSVVVIASDEVLRRALDRSTQRETRLLERLGAPLASSGD